jgi:ATP-dependent Lhr-like helicase
VRYVAVEDAALYRDALGVVLPAGLPDAFLAPQEQAVERLLARWARTHGPFDAREVARRWGLGIAAVDSLLGVLERDGKVVRGGLGGHRDEWCDAQVLRRLRQRTLAKLRDEVAPVEASVFARFVLAWQGVSGPPSLGLPEVLDQLQGVSLPVSQLDGVLARRVKGYRPDQLDQSGAMGEVVWIGRGSVGVRDGRVALYRRDRVHLLLDPPEPPEGFYDGAEGAMRRTLLDHLEQRGASFVSSLCAAAGSARGEVMAKVDEVVAALWGLAWAGLVTNDTFQPLRQLGAKRRGRGSVPGAGGRWSAVSELLVMPANDTEKALARASLLLDRYGVASGAAARAEGLRGGFSAVYPVLRSMEEGGKVRRGWFVDGIDGAQFALPGAVDRLRSHRDRGEDDVVVVPATDPANPYGAVLPWPASEGTPKRALGAELVLVGGEAVLYVERGGKSWSVLGEPDVSRAQAAVSGWVDAHPRRSRIEIQRIDGGPAREHPWAAWLGEVGFVDAYKGFVVAGA